MKYTNQKQILLIYFTYKKKNMEEISAIFFDAASRPDMYISISTFKNIFYVNIYRKVTNSLIIFLAI